MSDFEISLLHDEGKTYLWCAGEIDVMSANSLREAIDVAVDSTRDELRLDTSRVTKVGMAGISAIMLAGIACKTADVGFSLHAGNKVRKALDEAGLWWVGVLPDPYVGTWNGQVEAPRSLNL
jgi:anti-anti-sigma regulatory factor